MKDIVTLIRTAREEPTSENIETMWRHVFAIPAWYFLPSQLDGPATPLVAQVDGGNWLVAFTHFRALNEFARERGMRSDQGEVPMLALSPAESCVRVREVAPHIDGVVFNLGSDLAFRAPPEALAEFASRFVEPRQGE